jgi:hypothetical protein
MHSFYFLSANKERAFKPFELEIIDFYRSLSWNASSVRSFILTHKTFVHKILKSQNSIRPKNRKFQFFDKIEEVFWKNVDILVRNQILRFLEYFFKNFSRFFLKKNFRFVNFHHKKLPNFLFLFLISLKSTSMSYFSEINILLRKSIKYHNKLNQRITIFLFMNSFF